MFIIMVHHFTYLWLIGKFGSGLPKTTGWIHRAALKQRHVQNVGGCTYKEVTDDGLVITDKDGKDRTLDVDTVIICAGQVPTQTRTTSPLYHWPSIPTSEPLPLHYFSFIRTLSARCSSPWPPLPLRGQYLKCTWSEARWRPQSWMRSGK